jgi:hypothetical protein
MVQTGYTPLIRSEDGSKTDRGKEPSPGGLQMGIFGEKSSLGVLLRLTRQGHALGDEDAHPPLFQMGVFDDDFANEHLPAKALSHLSRVALPASL